MENSKKLVLLMHDGSQTEGQKRDEIHYTAVTVSQ